ncbi:MAG: hypothetical protein OEM97_10990, partial [Acidimicrobiia bacterium]|nr:hypothetical protein [Acidimicrobiia bacterium]
MSRRLTAEDLWEIPRVGAPCIDPRGLVLVVPVTSYSHDGTATTRLWRIDEGDAQPLTAPRASASEPAISPDGSTLAFVRKVDDVAQIHVMALDGGEPEAITNFPLGATGPKWLPVGSGVVCLGTVYRDALSLEDAAARPATRRVGRTTAHVTEGRFFRYWDE